MTTLNNLSASVRLTISNPQSETHAMFGPGIASLCEGVQELGSLNAAAKSMHMAYSKAWRIIKATEESLGMDLLVRDGAHGSCLTPEGVRLVETYRSLHEYLSAEANKALHESTR
jgi:molybdate transport system regulatory protein